MTVYECLREIKKCGGSFELTDKGKVTLTIPNDAVFLQSYIQEHREELAKALRPREIIILSGSDELLKNWNTVRFLGLVVVVNTKLNTEKGYLLIDYIPLIDPWVLDSEFLIGINVLF